MQTIKTKVVEVQNLNFIRMIKKDDKKGIKSDQKNKKEDST